jgi:Zn-dependent peptidase ImmA (M78 family)/DNA-binding XRE family transcriptional regulator
MSLAFVNPTLLSWSRIRAGLTEAQVARGLPVKTEKVLEWESGEALPTFKQAQKWANIAHVPFGFLFLSSPPVELLPLPDLRVVGGVQPEKPSINLIDTIKDVLRKQDWYIEYLQDHGYKNLPFVGRFSVEAAVPLVVADMKSVLKIDDQIRRLTPDEYFREIVVAAEAAGVLVMRSGIVGSNTRRKLDVGEFRGFAISSSLAPVVFINSADAPSARLFTLIHELAHIWIGSTGISSVSINVSQDVEVFCNAVAGEFLASEKNFRALWRADIDWRENIPLLRAEFHVSQFVVARRAYDLGYITQEQYSEHYLGELKAFRDKQGSGGNYYRTAEAKNSLILSKVVLSETFAGRLLFRDAAKLLSIQPSKIKKYADTIFG